MIELAKNITLREDLARNILKYPIYIIKDDLHRENVLSTVGIFAGTNLIMEVVVSMYQDVYYERLLIISKYWGIENILN